MAKVTNSRQIMFESDEEVDIELGVHQESADEQDLEHDTAALLETNWKRKRLRTALVTVSLLFLMGVSIGVTARYLREHPDSKNIDIGKGFPTDLDRLETIGGEKVQNGDVVPFLDVQFSPDERALFVLSKEHWNSSFIVYPTVVKRAAPVMFGAERGGILSETNDFAFHFELSLDGQHLQLVQEYHYASLQGVNADQLQQMFDDSQWPGYVIKVPIYTETEGAFYLPSDVFLANGFFVSSALASSDFTALEGPSESFARNTMLFVEYGLASGVIEVNYAIGLLPDMVMPQRVADDRVGYFAKRYTRYSLHDLDTNDRNGYHQWDSHTTVIHRRKLEMASNANMTKNPITYYIDPSVPDEWREAFASGVNAWIPAFERIGFPNAIRAVLPGDSEWPSDYRLGDLRYNSISVMISEQTYAYGPTVIDPRSGEILHSDIVFEYGFFNEAMTALDMVPFKDPILLRKVSDTDSSDPSKMNKKSLHSRTGERRACGLAYEEQQKLDRVMLSSVAGDKNGFVSKKLLAQHFADIVMHEVGHTLGLRHNFAGSSAYSRDQLRDPAFVAEHGISASIMDYLPANIFSDLTKDEVEKHAFFMTKIGAYDYAAIAYGYSVVDGEVPGFKHSRLTDLAAATPLFLTDESFEYMLNPYAQIFDLSSDSVDYAADRLKFVQNARRSDSTLKAVSEDASWATLWERERVYLRLLEHAIYLVRPILGGVNITNAHRGRDERSYNATFLPKDTQMKALDLLLRIVQAEKDVFPELKDYGSFVEVIGFDDEDCNESNLDYACLGRGIVDVGAYVLQVRRKALTAALFPSMERLVQQDGLNPLTLNELLNEVVKAMNNAPYSFTLKDYLNNYLEDILSNRDTDSRLSRAIEEKWNITQPSRAKNDDTMGK